MSEGFVEKAGGVIYPVCLLALLSAPVIWAYQIIYWLRWGRWFPISFADGLHWLGWAEPRFSWAGVQKVVHWLLNLPLAIALALIIFGIMFAYTALADSVEKSRKPTRVS